MENFAAGTSEGATLSAAVTPPAEMNFACALKSNGLMRFVTNLNQCKKSEQKLTIKPGPVLTCVQPDGSVRSVSSFSRCKPPAQRLTLPAEGITYFCAANSTGVLRKVGDPSQCITSREFAVFVPQANNAPVAANQSVSTDEDTAKSITLTATDEDGDTLTYTIVDGPVDGTLGGSAPNVTYTPDADFNGTDTFTFKANDGKADSNTAKVTITVNPTNDTPDAGNDTATAEEDVQKVIDVLSNDTGLGDTPITVSIESQGSKGTATANSDNTITYKPNPDANGSDSFVYKVCDADSTPECDTATVEVQISAVSDQPQATDDGSASSPAATVSEDSTTGATVNVLSNDTGLGDTPITVGIDSQGSKGTATANSDNTVTYVPGADENGSDSFVYEVCDGDGDCDTATVTVAINPLNDAPTLDLDNTTGGNDSTATFNEPETQPGPGVALAPNADVADIDDTNIESATVTLTNRLDGDANESLDADVGATGITKNYESSSGVLTLTAPGSGATIDQFEQVLRTVEYNNTAAPPNSTSRTVNFKVNDGEADSAIRTATVSVVPLNEPPVVDLDSTTEGIDSTASFTENGAPANLAPNATVTDSDDSNLASAEIRITNLLDGADELLAVDVGTTGIDATYDSANGTLALTGTATVAQYEQVLKTATYTNSSDTPDTTERSIAFVVNDGLDDSAPATSTVSVAVADDPPVAVDDSATQAEDSGATDIDVLANDTDADGGPMSISSASDPANGTVVLTGGTTGSHTGLTYQPDPNYCNDPGDATDDTFTYTLNGGDTATVSVKVTCVDDSPVANDDSRTVLEDSGATNFDVLANDTDADGDPIEITQVSDPDNGTAAVVEGTPDQVSYEPDPNYCNDPGDAPDDTFTYTVTGGDTATVSVKVTCVDDPPVAVNDSATVLEDAAATNVPVLDNDTDIDGGPKTISSASDPANGTVVVTGGGSGLTYQPDPNYCNDPGAEPEDTFTYTLNGGSTATVSMQVTCVNDAPSVANDSFSGAIHNTSFVVDDPSDAAPSVTGAKKTITGDVLSNDSDIETPGSISVVANTNITSTNGGKATIESDGDFTYVSDPSDNCSPASDTFNYTVTDNDSGGAQTTQGTVTINLSGCVWYVDNDPAETGNAGTSADPFDGLSSAAAKSVANQTVFVHKGTSTYTGGFTLDANERLIGEAVNLVVGGDTLFTGTPANRPQLSGTVNLNSGNTISGVAVAGSGAPAIAGASGDTSGTIADVTLSGAAGGLDLNTTSGIWNLSDLTVNTTGGDAIRAVTAGTVNFTSAGTISVTAAAGRGLNLSGTATSGVIDSTTVTSSANEGIRIDDDTGSLVLDDMNLTTTGTGLDIDSSNDVTVNTSGDADITSAGTAVSLTTVTSNPSNMPDVTLDQVSSTGGATGINIDDIGAGTFSANGGTLSGHSGAELDVNNGSGNITYPGTIGNGSGLSVQITSRSGGTIALSGNINDTNDAGGGIDMSGNTGGTVTFSGTTKTLNTGASPAFSSTGSNPTVTFSGGGLDIDTTSGAGLSATGGGTVTVGTGANPNTIDSTTGTALNIANTTIGSGGLTFRSISSGAGANNGISLVSTGAGGLTVTGLDGADAGSDPDAGSGGTITGKTGADGSTTAGTGVFLSNANNVSLNGMTITNHQNYGIRGTEVDGFRMTFSLVGGVNGTNAATPLNEGSVSFIGTPTTGYGLRGTVAFLDNEITGGLQRNVSIDNATGTMNLNFLRNNVHHTSSGDFGDDGFAIEVDTSAVMFANVSNNTFTAHRGDHFNLSLVNNANADLTFTNNDMQGGAVNPLGQGVLILGATYNGTFKYDISNNGTVADPFTGNVQGGAIHVNKGSGTGTFSGRITNNVIGDPAVTGSGSAQAFGIIASARGAGGSHTTLIHNNMVRQYFDRGIVLEAGEGSPTFNATVTSNTVSNFADAINSLHGIHFEFGILNGDNAQITTDVRNNLIANAGNEAQGGVDFRMRAAGSNDVFVAGCTTCTSAANTQAFIDGQNPDGTSFSVSLAANGTPNATYNNGPASPLPGPNLPTLPPAP